MYDSLVTAIFVLRVVFRLNLCWFCVSLVFFACFGRDPVRRKFLYRPDAVPVSHLTGQSTERNGTGSTDANQGKWKTPTTVVNYASNCCRSQSDT